MHTKLLIQEGLKEWNIHTTALNYNGLCIALNNDIPVNRYKEEISPQQRPYRHPDLQINIHMND